MEPAAIRYSRAKTDHRVTGGQDLKAAPHTLSVFDDDLDRLRASVCEMGGRVEAAVADAVTALVQGDPERARRVIEDDRKVDALAAQIERTAVNLIALRSPLADDLRDVLAAFKIAGLVARIGDCAKNIAHRTKDIGDARGLPQLASLGTMEHEVSAMLKAALDAFARRDGEAAAKVAAMDDTVDTWRAAITRSLIEHMTRDSRSIQAATHLLFAAQKLERVGDHAVGIAEMVGFAAGQGEDLP
jgi:phosphate transport system protein